MTKSWFSLPPFPRASHSRNSGGDAFGKTTSATRSVRGSAQLSKKTDARSNIGKKSVPAQRRSGRVRAETIWSRPSADLWWCGGDQTGRQIHLAGPSARLPLSGPPFDKPHQPRLAKYCLCSSCNFPVFWKVAECFWNIDNEMKYYTLAWYIPFHTSLIQHFWFWLDLQMKLHHDIDSKLFTGFFV